jgi:heme O synthase-like polyprenyltransferase
MTRATRLAQTNIMAAHFAASGLSRWTAVLSDYWTLTKPEVNFLILITTFACFYLASPGFSLADSPALQHPFGHDARG